MKNNEAITEVIHFTTNPDNSYGHTFNQIVNEYLKTGYSDEQNQHEVTVYGKIYKVLKRGEITAFYDADGNTIFDVTNERLKLEHEWLESHLLKLKQEVEVCDIMKRIRNTQLTCGGGLGEKCSVCERMEPALLSKGSSKTVEDRAENSEEAVKEDLTITTEQGPDVDSAEPTEEKAGKEDNTDPESCETESISQEESKEEMLTEEKKLDEEKPQYSGVDGAIAKLQAELKADVPKNKGFAEPIIEYLIERCRESESLASDICQNHKTWKKCYDYIFEKAKKKLNSISGPVRSDVVFEWAEDYFHKDDKAEEEEKSKREAEAKAKREKAAAERKAKANEKTAKDSKRHSPNKDKSVGDTPQKEQPKAKRNSKDMEGQLDLFSMMGM